MQVPSHVNKVSLARNVLAIFRVPIWYLTKKPVTCFKNISYIIGTRQEL